MTIPSKLLYSMPGADKYACNEIFLLEQTVTYDFSRNLVQVEKSESTHGTLILFQQATQGIAMFREILYSGPVGWPAIANQDMAGI